MKHLTLFATAFLACVTMASAQRLKIATVNMERLFDDYYRTAEIQKEINIERARIQKDNNIRLADIREIENTLQEIRLKLEDPEKIGAKEFQDLTQKAKDLKQDGVHQERERQEFLERRNRSLNDKLRKQMRGVFVELQRVVSARAKVGNYDYIFDSSGKSNQGIPFVLHAREMTDLTDSLLAEVNEGSGADDSE